MKVWIRSPYRSITRAKFSFSTTILPQSRQPRSNLPPNLPLLNPTPDSSSRLVQAASGRGGRSGRGGDLLWRWGNPKNYHHGGGDGASSSTSSRQQLFQQHNAHWIENDLKLTAAPAASPPSSSSSHHHHNPGILIFNNRPTSTFSTVVELELPSPDISTGGYPSPSTPHETFLPASPKWSYQEREKHLLISSSPHLASR